MEALFVFGKSKSVGPMNIGSDKEYTLGNLPTAVQALFPDKKLKIRHLDLPSDDPQIRQPDLTLAKAELAPWAPRMGLNEGLKLMIDWLKSEIVL